MIFYREFKRIFSLDLRKKYVAERCRRKKQSRWNASKPTNILEHREKLATLWAILPYFNMVVVVKVLLIIP